MDLRGFEFYAITGNPVVGAQVTVRAASLTHPNPNAIAGTANTDGNGMWSITGLAEGAYDADVTISGKFWRHKGMSMTSLSGLYVNGAPFTPVNFAKNGGIDLWPAGNGPHTITTTPATTWIPPFATSVGTGSTATLTRETTIVAPGSGVSGKVVYTHSSGQFKAEVTLGGAVLGALRGKTLVIQTAAYQGAANQMAVTINDGTTTTTGARSITTGSWITLSATVAIPTSASTLKFAVIADVSGTFYFDNVMFAIGTTVSQYVPNLWDGDGNDTYLPGLTAILGALNVQGNIGSMGSINAATALTGASAAITGTLTATDVQWGPANQRTLQSTNLDTITRSGWYYADTAATNTPSSAFWIVQHMQYPGSLVACQIAHSHSNGDSYIRMNNGTTWQAWNKLWNAANDGSASGLDADLLDGISSAAYARLGTSGIFTASPVLAYQVFLQAQESPTFSRPVLGISTPSNTLYMGNSASPLVLQGSTINIVPGSTLQASGSTIWHAANDGAGSGLDADLLDGLSSAAFAQLSGAAFTGAISTTATLTVTNATGGAVPVQIRNTGASPGYSIGVLNQAGSDWELLMTHGQHEIKVPLIVSTPVFPAATISYTGSSPSTAGNGLTVNGGLRVVGDSQITGVKSAIVKDREGIYRAFHSIESPEPYFEDFGRARLIDGEAFVEIPEDFAQFVGLDDYEVFVTPLGASALYIADRTGDGFHVRTLFGRHDVQFTWRILARRADVSDERLACADVVES